MRPFSSRSKTLLAALATALAGPSLLAMSADHVGSQVVLPLVLHTPTQRTTVFVENHGVDPVKAVLYYVGAKSSSSPARRSCPGLTLLPLSVMQIDVATVCSLNGPDDVGTLSVLSKRGAAVARLSAFARIEAVGQPLTTFSVQGLPMGYLEGNNTVHIAAGLRNDTLAVLGKYRTDCHVATFWDAYSTGQWVKITLKNRDGVPIGTPVSFGMRPWELVHVQDIFAKAGVSAAFGQARAEIALSGGNAAALGYCTVTNVAHPSGRPETTFQLAKVIEPELESRRRNVKVSATPTTTPVGGSFEFLPGNTRVVHGMYLRHPDLLSCSVDRMELVLTIAAPNSANTFGGMSNSVPEFLAFDRTAINGSPGPGWADLWGLEVTWNPTFPLPGAPLPYSITCQTGNGASLADQMFRN